MGCYGDAQLVAALGERRRELGLVVPGPMQAAAVAVHGAISRTVAEQRNRYRHRLLEVLAGVGQQAGFGGCGTSRAVSTCVGQGRRRRSRCCPPCRQACPFNLGILLWTRLSWADLPRRCSA